MLNHQEAKQYETHHLHISCCFSIGTGCAGCQPTGGNDPTPEPTPTPTPIPDDPKPDDEPTVQSPEQLLAAMTLEEKIGQLFIVRPESLDPTLTPEQVHSTRDYGVQALTEEMAAQLSKYPAGGLFSLERTSPGRNNWKPSSPA